MYCLTDTFFDTVFFVNFCSNVRKRHLWHHQQCDEGQYFLEQLHHLYESCTVTFYAS